MLLHRFWGMARLYAFRAIGVNQFIRNSKKSGVTLALEILRKCVQ